MFILPALDINLHGETCLSHVGTEGTDNDPLFRFHRWLANLRILDIEEVKTVPFAPCSHPFVERAIRTVREELLNQVLFWNQLDVERKLSQFLIYYNGYRVHSGIDAVTPRRSGVAVANGRHWH